MMAISIEEHRTQYQEQDQDWAVLNQTNISIITIIIIFKPRKKSRVMKKLTKKTILQSGWSATQKTAITTTTTTTITTKHMPYARQIILSTKIIHIDL